MTNEDIRRLSVFEKFYFERNQLLTYSNFFVAGVYNHVDVNALSHALRELMITYPNFTLNVFGNDCNDLMLRRVEKVVFEDVVEFKEVLELDETQVGSQLDELTTQKILSCKFKFNVDKPLWKLLVINNRNIVFYCDHLLFDGLSGSNFHRLLLEGLNKYLKIEQQLHVLFDSEIDKINRSYDSIYDEFCKPGIRTIFKSLFKEFAPLRLQTFVKSVSQWLYPDNSGLIGEVYQTNTIVKQITFDVWTRYINIPPSQLDQALTNCRNQSVSLTALIAYSALRSIKHLSQDKDISFGIPVNIRDMVQLSKDEKEFGVYVTGADVVAPLASIEQSSINWDQVRHLQHEITKNVKSTSNLKIIGMFNYINIKEWVQSRIGKPVGTNFEISNLGWQRTDDSSDVKLEQLYFNQSFGVNGSAIGINVVSTTIGGMNISFTCHPEDVQRFAKCFDLFKDILLRGTAEA